MKNRITWDKIKGHWNTINAHKRMVMKNCFKVGLYRQGLLHDLSKYYPIEFINGCRYYQGGLRSPNNGEREEKGFSEAWMHHKGRNKHHYEYWQDYSLYAKNGPAIVGVEMPRRYVAEMLMDRIAASKNYMKEAYDQHQPLKYYEKGRSSKLLHPKTDEELYHLLKILDVYGEEVLFSYVRNIYLKEK